MDKQIIENIDNLVDKLNEIKDAIATKSDEMNTAMRELSSIDDDCDEALSILGEINQAATAEMSLPNPQPSTPMKQTIVERTDITWNGDPVRIGGIQLTSATVVRLCDGVQFKIDWGLLNSYLDKGSDLNL